MIKNQRKSYDIIVLEDSSQAVFGGGQKVTVAVCEMLSKFHAILMVDYVRDSKFQKRISSLTKKSIFLKKEAINPFNAILNIFRIYSFSKKNEQVLFYCTTNRGLFYGWIFSFLGRKYIYHAHLARYKCIVKFLSGKSEKIICVSKYVKDFIGSDKCVVVNNPHSFIP